MFYVDGASLLLDLAGAIDLGKERARLQKETAAVARRARQDRRQARQPEFRFPRQA